MNRQERRHGVKLSAQREAALKRIDLLHQNTRNNRFLLRQDDMSRAHDKLMLPLRMFRDLLAMSEGCEQHWAEIAAMVNVVAMFGKIRERFEWTETLNATAGALIAIRDRNQRVGGRWAAIPAEAEAITAGINLIDFEILPQMQAVDFIQLAMLMNDMEDETEKS